ncbi:BlaI/MecI/CopY family transcriptional regulator [Lysinibacillus macroides]|uniref:CopY family transcriptional regulator n=1 Tax=Lysinibacillus macroides TaxID=33935 RepID=A0A0M9DL50_9BACI|nr:BlaI/MecI/CopY family transcriptional regulator [Lysinibacillus macroides]KOY82833.1 CopY family transcriptional regulator [Lysinibacillus macroides]QPR66117.1 BlaI/MecI/CopY family transcriptional regulator [Lysinibacillus macroides]
MPKFQSLTDTEMEVMQIIWKLNRSVQSSELLTIFSEKGWKGQTIATFLSRLVDKGLLSVTKGKGRANIYNPRLSFKEYKKWEAQSLLDTMYQGSVKTFLATLYDEKVTTEELDELKKWFSDK